MSNENFENYLSHLTQLQNDSESFVVVTLVKQIGSSPQNVGARILVKQSGLVYGTVGGGKVENRAIQEAQKMIQNKTRYLFVDWNLQKDIGMTCGGVVSFFFEQHCKELDFHIAVFGAGHIAQEFIPLLLKLDCQVSCYDSRQEWLDKLPPSKKLQTYCTSDAASEVAHLPYKSYVAIMTMGHGTDIPILTAVMKQRDRFAYVGNIGSDQKALRIKQDLRAAGFEGEILERFYCPMGETFGNNSPIEIAFSIVAQILKTRDQVNKGSET